MTLLYLYDVVKLAPIAKKRRILRFELDLKIDHQPSVEFCGDYDGDNFESQKPNLHPLIGLN